ncbi:MAG: hypothetical protein JO300_03635 [Silvibacterium sp.]|nr:hypothetical protein [Silvibacterium sp.]
MLTSIDKVDDMETMRTTLALRADAHANVKQFAEEHSVSMGEAASELIMRGVSRPLATRIKNGLHIPILPDTGEKITSELVKQLEAEQDLESAIFWARGGKR